MKHFVERTCTVVGGRDEERGGGTGLRGRGEAESHPLEAFREVAAYVLLGPPGAGKTEAFRREARLEGVQPIPAGDFQELDAKPEWQGKTLYIDGLDETRAGAFNGRTPFGQIRVRLQRLGYPRFRISCRESDWFGEHDRERLKAVAPNGELLVLRLDPLTDHGVLDILERNHGVDDPAAFVAEARKQGVADLLLNPQNLGMLAEAVAEANEWPRTRAKTFDIACRKLVSEEDPGHQIACRGTVNTETLLDGAGDLCTLVLLTGKAGVTVPGTKPDVSHPPLDQFPGGDTELLRRVVGTKLFESLSEGRLAPAHRQIAEFLAARRLAHLTADGLSVRRVLALMSGFDGGILSEMRGLTAWLAVHSKCSRSEIVERDPLGVILYGDIRDFSPDEKGLVFDCLRREVHLHPWILDNPDLNSRLSDLVVPELKERFRSALTDPTTNEADASVARMVLQAIESVMTPRGFNEELLSVVRDSGWQASIRYLALKLCIRLRTQDEDVGDRLSEMLHYVYHNERDMVINSEIAGHLLAELYPSGMSINHAAQYLRYPRSSSMYDSYTHFWRDTVIEQSTPDQLFALLDILRERVEAAPDPWRLGPGGWDLPDSLPSICLKALMARSPSTVQPSLVYYWHSASQLHPLVGLDTNSVVGWLSDQPGAREELVRIAGNDDDLHRARSAAFIALRAGHGPEALPRRLQSVRCVSDPGEADLPPVHHPAALGHDPVGSDRPDLDPRLDTHLRTCRDQLQSNLEAVRANRGPPALLYNLAKAYLGGFAGLWAPTASERLSLMLGREEHLVDSALAALKGAIARPDLPRPSELVQLATQGRVHLLAYPVMAGLRESASTDPATRPPLDDLQARIALTLWHTTGEPPRFFRQTSRGEQVPRDDWKGVPEWLTQLVESCPELAADVLVSVGRAFLRAGKEPRRGYHELVYPMGSSQLTKLASLPLLEGFPVRAQARLLPHLRDLLVAACCHCDGAVLADIVGNKLRYKSMTVAQRVYWLAAGHLVAPDRYSEPLESFASSSNRRIRHLAGMVVRYGGLPHQLEERWDASVVVPLIRLLGRTHRPTPYLHTGVRYRQTLEMEVADYVGQLIHRLAIIPDSTSTEALAELHADQSLQHWSDKISAAAYRHRTLRRESEFRQPCLDQVADVLDNGGPANAADLAALTVDLLLQFSRRIRDGATSDWRQYWNVDQYNRAETPKPEDACRDTLLSDLEQRLTRLGVETAKEGYYAEDKRSDISVACGGFNIPIEIKRSCHRELWSAIHTQLIPRYTRDPGANGYGIYLVFWFGEAEGCRPTPRSGPRPKSAKELQTALLDNLTPSERRKISVCVIDVSKPDASK